MDKSVRQPASAGFSMGGTESATDFVEGSDPAPHAARSGDLSGNLPVIASQRVRAKRGPMTGSAKQSISPRQDSLCGKMDCFVARAPRNDDVGTVRFHCREV
jgi:hypothetical protein